MIDHQDETFFLRIRHQALCFLEGSGERFFDEHMFTRFERCSHQQRMGMYGRCDRDTVDTLRTDHILGFRHRRYRRIHLFERRKALFPLVRDNGHGNVWMRHKVANDVRTPVTVSDNPYFHTEQISISEGGIPAFCAFRMSTVFFRVSRRFYPPSPHARTLSPFPGSTSYSPKEHARPASSRTMLSRTRGP